MSVRKFEDYYISEKRIVIGDKKRTGYPSDMNRREIYLLAGYDFENDTDQELIMVYDRGSYATLKSPFNIGYGTITLIDVTEVIDEVRGEFRRKSPRIGHYVHNYPTEVLQIDDDSIIERGQYGKHESIPINVLVGGLEMRNIDDMQRDVDLSAITHMVSIDVDIYYHPSQQEDYGGDYGLISFREMCIPVGG